MFVSTASMPDVPLPMQVAVRLRQAGDAESVVELTECSVVLKSTNEVSISARVN